MWQQLKRRWLWGVLFAVGTGYIMRERRRNKIVSLNGNGLLSQKMLTGVLKTGRAVIDRTLELAKTR